MFVGVKVEQTLEGLRSEINFDYPRVRYLVFTLPQIQTTVVV